MQWSPRRSIHVKRTGKTALKFDALHNGFATCRALAPHALRACIPRPLAKMSHVQYGADLADTVSAFSAGSLA